MLNDRNYTNVEAGHVVVERDTELNVSREFRQEHTEII